MRALFRKTVIRLLGFLPIASIVFAVQMNRSLGNEKSEIDPEVMTSSGGSPSRIGGLR